MQVNGGRAGVVPLGDVRVERGVAVHQRQQLLQRGMGLAHELQLHGHTSASQRLHDHLQT